MSRKTILMGCLVHITEFEGIWLWRNWSGIWPSVWLVGIQFLHLSQGMMNSLNCGIQRIPSSLFSEPNITKEFVIPIPLNSFEFREPNSPFRNNITIDVFLHYFSIEAPLHSSLLVEFSQRPLNAWFSPISGFHLNHGVLSVISYFTVWLTFYCFMIGC